MWNLIVYEMPAIWGGDLVPMMRVGSFDDFVECMAMNTQLTAAMRTIEFASDYILLCVNGS